MKNQLSVLMILSCLASSAVASANSDVTDSTLMEDLGEFSIRATRDIEMPNIEKEMGAYGRTVQTAILQNGVANPAQVSGKKGYCRLRLDLGQMNKISTLTLKQGTLIELKGAHRVFSSTRQVAFPLLRAFGSDMMKVALICDNNPQLSESMDVGFMRKQLGDLFELDFNR